jgi:hypothetical protein
MTTEMTYSTIDQYYRDYKPESPNKSLKGLGNIYAKGLNNKKATRFWSIRHLVSWRAMSRARTAAERIADEEELRTGLHPKLLDPFDTLSGSLLIFQVRLC